MSAWDAHWARGTGPPPSYSDLVARRAPSPSPLYDRYGPGSGAVHGASAMARAPLADSPPRATRWGSPTSRLTPVAWTDTTSTAPIAQQVPARPRAASGREG